MNNHCRNCDFWKEVGQWQGICTKDKFTKPQWSQSATPSLYGCKEYQEFKKARYYQEVKK